MLPRASSRGVARATLVVSLAGVVLGAGCVRRRPAPADWRNRLTDTARATSFRPDTTPVRNDGGGEYPPNIPAMTFARASTPRGEVGIALRVTSRGAYPRLGIAEGVNYVWVVSGKPARIAVVPANSSQPAYWLETVPHPQMGGDVCQIDPNAAQLSFETSSGGGGPNDAAGSGPSAVAAALVSDGAFCICVGGGWLHGPRRAAELTQANAGPLVPKR